MVEKLANSHPYVSVVIPAYNEECVIERCLRSVLEQDYAGRIEVLVVDGMSTDQTRQIVEDIAWRRENEIRLLDNPDRVIPVAMNTGIQAAQGKIIVRMDAHAIPNSDYVKECVRCLLQNKAQNVGGVWDFRPSDDTLIAKAISVAVGSRLGAGDASYRIMSKEQEQFVDTVPFGCFYKETWQELGGYDENLLTNEDYDFNYRIRLSGGRILLSPRIRSTYFPRSTLRALTKQYFRYGWWKAHMLRKYPASIRWRQLAPPVLIISVVCLTLLAPFFFMARLLLVALLTVYLGAVLLVSLQKGVKNRNLCLCAALSVVYPTIHVSWGLGFVFSSIAGIIFRS